MVWLGKARQAGNGITSQAGMNDRALGSPEKQAEDGNLALPGRVYTAAVVVSALAIPGSLGAGAEAGRGREISSQGRGEPDSRRPLS